MQKLQKKLKSLQNIWWFKKKVVPLPRNWSKSLSIQYMKMTRFACNMCAVVLDNQGLATHAGGGHNYLKINNLRSLLASIESLYSSPFIVRMRMRTRSLVIIN